MANNRNGSKRGIQNRAHLIAFYHRVQNVMRREDRYVGKSMMVGDVLGEGKEEQSGGGRTASRMT